MVFSNAPTRFRLDTVAVYHQRRQCIFVNILSACTNNVTGVVGEDLWLGTDPLLDDSDRYSWDGFAIRPLYPSFGDGMPDGWEVHFGLDPLNRSNALLDDDRDGGT